MMARPQATQPTRRHIEILGFIAESIESNGCAPTLREMASRFGWRSTNAGSDHLRRLERMGLLRVHSFKSRAIVLTEEGQALGHGWRRGKIIPTFTSKPATGYVDPPSYRCPRCSRVMFGKSHERHACAAEDLAVAS